jgi:N-acetylglucosaminyldiphosphoundecaprenol N-acetyl-beta-D-mannosaminyltransferase
LAGDTVKHRNAALSRRIYLNKVPVDIVQPRNLLIVLAGLIQRGEASQIAFVRTWDVYRAHHDPLLLKTLENAALVLPVSRMIVSMARFLRLPEPVTYFPFDTIIRILTWLESMGGSLFLLGGTPARIVSVEQNIRQTFPHVRFLGRYAGVFPRGMGESVVMAIRKADPDILLAGGGLPGRDRWLYRNRGSLNRGLMIWSGEWFDFVIQRRRRAVRTAVRNGREWIPELKSNPLNILRMLPLAFFWFRLLIFRLFR